MKTKAQVNDAKVQIRRTNDHNQLMGSFSKVILVYSSDFKNENYWQTFTVYQTYNTFPVEKTSSSTK